MLSYPVSDPDPVMRKGVLTKLPKPAGAWMTDWGSTSSGWFWGANDSAEPVFN